MGDFQSKIDAHNQQKELAKEASTLLKTITDTGSSVAKAVATAELHTKSVTVTNDLAKPSDIAQVVSAVNKLSGDLKTRDLEPVSKALDNVRQAISKLPTKYPDFPAFPELPESRKDVKVTNLSELKAYFKEVVTAVGALQASIKLDPTIEVKPADVNITQQKIDITPITKELANLAKAFKSVKTPNFDTSEITNGLKSLKDTINGLSFPVPNYVLPFSKDGKATQVILDASGNVPVSGTITVSTTGLATDTNQTSGTQKTQIVDAGGEVATVTGGKLDVNATASLAGTTLPIAAATTGVGVAILDNSGNQINSFGGGTQYADGAARGTATGTVMMVDDGTNVQSAAGTTAGVLKVDLSATTANATAVKTDSSATTQPVSAASLPLPTGAATAAKQPALGTAGTASTDVISVQGIASMTALKVDGSAVTQPVSGTVTATGPLTDTQLRASAVPVSLTSTTITGTVDTELTTADLDTGAGTDTRAVVGLVGSKSGGGVLIPGDATKGLAVDLTATGANTTALKVDGSAVTQPVSLTSTTITGTVASTQSGTWTVQPGNTANTTAWKVDGSAVTQPVSLASVPSHAVTNAGTFAVQATLAAETTKVIGTVNIAASQTVGLAAGTAVVGKVSIDQTTPGTTNLVALAANQSVNNAQIAGVATATGNGVVGTGVQRVAIASDNTAFSVNAVQSGSWNATTYPQIYNGATFESMTGAGARGTDMNVKAINSVTPLMGNGASGTGAQRVTLASDSTGQVAPAANATATGTAIYNNTALSSTKQAVKASAGNLYGYHIYNPNSVVIYIQVWNVASASVTVGTTAPTMVLAVPAGGWADSSPTIPITFGTALTIAATTTSTGSGAPTTALLCNIWYL